MSKEVRIVIAGDTFPSDKNIKDFKSGNTDNLYDEKIVSIFRDADYSICNLEGVLTDGQQELKKCGPVIKANTDAVAGLKNLGLTHINLANNHILDCDVEGLKQTCETLEKNGIRYWGTGDSEDTIKKYINIEEIGKKITIYTVSETMFNIPRDDSTRINLYDEYVVCRELSELKKQCDYLVVLYHGGAEFFWYNTEMLRTRFHRMADNGADLIIAQHTHNIGIQEKYKESLLVYGQGNFLLARGVNAYTDTGLLFELVISENGINVKQHLVRHVEGKVVYDDQNNLEIFTKRNKEYENGERFKEEYNKFADERILFFMDYFRGISVTDKIAKKILPKKIYAKYLKKMYKDIHILRMISAIQFEEHREAVVAGLWNIIDERNKNRMR